MTNKIRLLIADDHEVVRSGLKTLLAGTEVKIAGEVATGEDAVKFALENEVGRRAAGYPHARRRRLDRPGTHQAGQARNCRS